jgi:hypothetical protein
MKDDNKYTRMSVVVSLKLISIIIIIRRKSRNELYYRGTTNFCCDRVTK